MKRKSSWKESGLLKGLGLLTLVLLCVVACISGGFTIMQAEYEDSDNWFETETSVYRIQQDMKNILCDYVENNNEMPEKDVYDNVSLEIYDWNKDSFKKEYEGGAVTGDTVRNWGYMYCLDTNENYWAYMEHGKPDRLLNKKISEEDGEEIYLVAVNVTTPEKETDAYYYEYTDFNTLKSYRENALPVFIVTLWVATVILILEIISAGHSKEEEGIHLSWLDRVPFDVMSIVAVTIFSLAAVGLAECLDAGIPNANLRYIQNAVLPISCVEIMCLSAYFWLISLTVRIKAHTLLSNNLVTKAVIYLAGIISAGVSRIMDTPRNWVLLVAGGYVLVTLVQISALGYTGFIGKLVLVFTLVSGGLMLGCGKDFNVLLKASEEMSSGNLEYCINEEELSKMKGPFHEMGQFFTKIGDTMENAVSEKMKSERMKTELITNVSHDLKTPLTSIINYVDLLKKEHTHEQEEEYLNVLDRQSQRLKKLTEDVVEASKASTGNITVDIASIDVQEILEQSIAEYEEKIEEADLRLIVHNLEDHMKVKADGRLLWRSVRNLLSNICKYAMPSTRVYIDVVRRDHNIVMIFKNTSRDELNITAEELKERFVRGDSSRHVEGSGLGLSIVESLMKLMGGTCQLTVDGDLFKAELSLPEAEME